MQITRSQSPRAVAALDLVEALQARFVDRLEAMSPGFAPVVWGRDEGRHGGGVRLQNRDTAVFDRVSVNVSGVHYDDLPDKRLASASALSAIVHPSQPLAPSVHLHISYTALRSGAGYWRMMVDLNPSHPDPAATDRFRAAAEGVLGAHAAEARQQGDRYFYIPALERHRGVAHYYLEQFDSGDFGEDRVLARAFGEAMIDTYGSLLEAALGGGETPAQREAQRAYHTLYLFQVLTLDRGTTSGLLVHGQNDVGILGSLPSRVDPVLLASWAERVPAVQRPLVEGLVAVLPGDGVVADGVKQRLADVVRAHYRAHPEALALQARGNVLPPTVQNHRSP